MSNQILELNNKDNLTGIVFDIQRYSLGDGHGIRTTIFMKGCNLRCLWCQNPESFNAAPEIAYRSDRCIQCGACVEACPRKAVYANVMLGTKSDLCISCGDCAKVCPTRARYMIGQSYTVAELLSVVERDTIFFNESDGGVTLSGGEATLQHEFVHEFLKACKNVGINTAIETNGSFNRARFKELLPFIDRIYFDIKLISAREHKLYTGADNRIILDNAAWLTKCFNNVTFRIPLIPEMTLTNDNLKNTVQFLNDLNVLAVEFCLYQNGWENKVHWLNTKHEPLGLPQLSVPDITGAIEYFNTSGIAVKVN